MKKFHTTTTKCLLIHKLTMFAMFWFIKQGKIEVSICSPTTSHHIINLLLKHKGVSIIQLMGLCFGS